MQQVYNALFGELFQYCLRLFAGQGSHYCAIVDTATHSLMLLLAGPIHTSLGTLRSDCDVMTTLRSAILA